MYKESKMKSLIKLGSAISGVVLCLTTIEVAKADIVPGTVSTDAFDFTQGTVITNDDTIIDPINAFRRSGGFEDGHTLMRNGGLGSISFIEFATASPVTIGGVRLFAHNDGDFSYDGDSPDEGEYLGFRRAMSNFSLFADTNSDSVFETVVANRNINPNYALQTGNNAALPEDLDLTIPSLVGNITAQSWRLEVTQGSDIQPFEGARLVELDALAFIPTSVPEPTSVSGIALVSALGAWIKRKQKASKYA